MSPLEYMNEMCPYGCMFPFITVMLNIMSRKISLNGFYSPKWLLVLVFKTIVEMVLPGKNTAIMH